MPFADRRVDVQVKLCDPLTTRAIPQRFWCGFPTKRRYNNIVHTFTFYLVPQTAIEGLSSPP